MSSISAEENAAKLSTKVTDEDIANGVKDEFGVIYSSDGKRLLQAPRCIKTYSIRQGTLAICDEAFYYNYVDFYDDEYDDYHHLLSCEIESIEIPNSVMKIGEKAFSYCNRLANIVVESGNQFYDSRNNCNAIIETSTNTLILGCKNTIIPDSVTAIGDHAYSGYFRLNTISFIIPDSITSIGSEAFANCRGLTSITIPDSVTKIGRGAFEDCQGLSSITIPKSVTYIGGGAFLNCIGLSSIKVDSGNRVCDSRNNCNAIIATATNTLVVGCMNTVIPESVKAIGSYAFYGCDRLTNILIPNSVNSIGNGAFMYSRLVWITIPNSVITIGDKAFYKCFWLNRVSIPDTVKSIGNDAFKGCHGLTRINIPDLLTSIGHNVFSGCYKITDITIPRSVEKIDSGAFSGCSSLTSIIVESGNRFYDSRNNCNAIIETSTNTLILGCKNTIIPDSVTSIGDKAFYGRGLTSITIPDSIKNIGSEAFRNCRGLTDIAIPNSVRTIGGKAFCGCSAYRGSGLVAVGSVEYADMVGPTSITIPKSVSSIGVGAFSDCGSLGKITVESGNQFYDSRNNCNAIIETSSNTLISGCKNTVIPDSVTSIGDEAFRKCNGLTSITMPKSVTNIGRESFAHCGSLNSISISDSVTSIGRESFVSCARLYSIIIPNSVKNLGPEAFRDCSELTDISFQCPDTVLGEWVFDGCYLITNIYIPKGSREHYKKQLRGHFENELTEEYDHPSYSSIINDTSYHIPDDYDSYQQEVIKLDNGYNLVLAPPGCGKTDILAERIARARSKGTAFCDMLCLTFTNRAARGMRDRIAKRLGEDVDTSSLFVGNTHRFCSKFLFEQNLVPMSTSILDENDTTDIVESLIKKYKKSYEVVSYSVTRILQLQHLIYQMKSKHPQDLWMNLSCIQDISGLCHYLNLELGELYDKIEDIDDNQYAPTYKEAFRHIYLAKKYEEYKLNFGAVDFDDLLLITYNFLSDTQSDFHKYNWIQIDEVQDLNPIQFAIVDKLTNDNNFVVVYLGDEQQAIFSFIGAKLQTLDWLKKRCEGKLLHLYKNYRSPKYLLDVYNKFANDILDADPDFLPEPNDSKEAEFEDLIVDHVAEDTAEEYDRAVDYAEKYAKTGGRVAIIVATNKDADEISNSMGDIKHFKISGQDVFSTPEIQMLLAHMNVINFELNNIAWAKIFRYLKLFDESAQARDFSKTLSDLMFSPVDFLEYERSSFIKEVAKAFEDEMVIFDTETTGLDVYEDDIVQIAAIRIKKGVLVDKFNIFLKTDKTIPEYLGEIRNPLFDEYPNAIKYERDDGLRRFLAFVGTAPILGHNVEYDYHILDYNLQRDCGIDSLEDICPVYYDSLKLARLVEPHLKVYKLKSLLEVLGLEGENSHMADDDILATYELVKYCVNKAKPRLSNQMDFMVSNHEIIENFRKEYGPIHEHTKAMLYKRFPCDDTPAIVQEMDYIYNELKDKGIIKPNLKFKHILKFIEFDVIQKETERSLYEQLSNHSSELNTFKEADLCDSSTMEEKYFISTVHKAKGLEFENVIVFNAIDGVYPFFNSKTVEEQKEDARKFYVAISRAKKRLCIMTSKTRDVYSTKWHKWYNFNAEPSPFLNSISQYFKHIYNSDE